MTTLQRVLLMLLFILLLSLLGDPGDVLVSTE